MAKKAGYASVDAYRASLMGGTSAAPVKNSGAKETVHLVNLLDVSSSMNLQNKIGVALEGLNAEREKLSLEDNVDYVYSLTVFSYSTNIKKVLDRAPIKNVRHINFGAAGYTALNDAVGITLTELKNNIKRNKERIVVSIFTDGEENDSREFKNTDISKLVEECQTLGMVITFIGTDKDTKDVIKNFKIDASNTLTHNNTAKGVQDSFGTKFRSTINYSMNVAAGVSQDELTVGFYSKQTGKL